MRINKYLAHKGLTTRKGADALVEKGAVFINGKRASLGDKVLESDTVTLGKNTPKTSYAYFAYNKPKGIVTTNPQKGEQEIISIADFGAKVFPVGRLDKDSTGLIIMTNDGRVTDRLLNPDKAHEKEYVVETDKAVTESFVRKMSHGVNIGGYITKKCTVRKTGEKKFSIILTEGKNRQIRRMCAELGHRVNTLQRTRIMNITLRGLKPGSSRKIIGNEQSTFLKSIGL